MGKTPPRTGSAVTAEAIDALVKFLPIFEKPGFSFGEWPKFETEDGVLTVPAFEFSDDADRFLRALREHGWIEPFDWTKSQAQAARYCDLPEKLRKVGIGTSRKLLTIHVMKERFCEGHLAAVCESGHLAAILRRLREIREGL